MSDLPTLLPPNASALERDAEQVSAQRSADIPVVLSSLWNADKCDARWLGWLAWALSVDVWEADWSEDQKRNVLRESMAIHRVKGTVGAVRRALGALGFDIDITEWFEYGGTPHTFRLDATADDIFASGRAVNVSLLDLIADVIENVKPVRSHLDKLRIGERFQSDQSVRSAHAGTLVDSSVHDFILAEPV